MQKADVPTQKGKMTTDHCRGFEHLQKNPEPEGVLAAPEHLARPSIPNRITSVILRILNWVEMIFFKKYVLALRALSSPAADLVRLNTALRRDHSAPGFDARKDTSEKLSRINKA
jgi:hypothetical protein